MGSTMDSKEFDLYKDIRCRTNGEIYIGVVGPVRTGKSTFIKHFMELCVIPKMDNEYAKKRAVDELPQSGKGKTIMTTEPKFIPQDAVTISLDDGSAVKVRLVDCVGFTVGMPSVISRRTASVWSKHRGSTRIYLLRRLQL